MGSLTFSIHAVCYQVATVHADVLSCVTWFVRVTWLSYLNTLTDNANMQISYLLSLLITLISFHSFLVISLLDKVKC